MQYEVEIRNPGQVSKRGVLIGLGSDFVELRDSGPGQYPVGIVILHATGQFIEVPVRYIYRSPK